jgi:rhomboid protease GluP
MRPLFDRLPAGRAQTYHLVLASAAIPHHVRLHGRFWAVDVPVAHRGKAVKAISLYLNENPPVIDAPARPIGERTFSAAYVIAALSIVHWAIKPGLERQTFFSTYAADSGLILAGDYYRCITALVLHADGGHLLANAAGLAIFGTAVASICGWGVGWLIILAAGALGNYGAALWYGAGHLSVGASTALFGAVGLSSMLAFGMQIRQGSVRSWRAWAPLAGGMALLGFLGTAPATDLLAHMSGFLSGLALGLLYVLGVSAPLGWPIQMTSALISLSLLAGAWISGLYSSG